MQRSIMRRRKGAAREASGTSDAAGAADAADAADVTDVELPLAELAKPSPSKTSPILEKDKPPRKRGRPRKQVAKIVEPPPSSRSLGQKRVGTIARETAPASTLSSVKQSKDVIDIALSSQVHNMTIAEAPGKFDCFLERLDGSLPMLNRTQEPVDPILVRIPPLTEFIAPSPLKKSSWFLPRIGSVQPIDFDTPEAKPFSTKDISADCEGILEALNPQQVMAVTAKANRACLVLAGPGSGKTRVLTHRAAFLVRQYNLQSGRILAVTFTNKAAEEMKNRMRQLLSPDIEDDVEQTFSKDDFVVGTFHSICARLLRIHGTCIDIDSSFQICDASDARQVVALVMKDCGAGPGESSMANQVSMNTAMISKLKNNGETEMRRKYPLHVFNRVAEYRKLYDKKLREMNQLDFDDLLLETRRMLEEAPDVLLELQNRYLHILVDEWQDTNSVQFDIVTALAKKHRNIFVVGDADQSIYKFRGADIRNVTRFSETFPDALTVALEENYRSTGCIVNSAQAVIEGNKDRPSKPMRTTNAFGSPVVICQANDGRTEAWYILKRIRELLRTNAVSSLSDIAILYRMNSQSRLVEEAFVNASMPYHLVAGTRFYDRQEVKDVLSYVRLLVNPVDDMALLRAINTPPRGIGKKTVEDLQNIATSQSVSLLQALENLCDPNSMSDEDEVDDSAPLRKGALKKLAEFLFIIHKLRDEFADNIRSIEGNLDNGTTAASVIERVMTLTDYKSYLEKRSKTAGTSEINKFEERWQNIAELKRAADRYGTLSEFLESVSLLSKPAGEDEEKSNQAVSLMTMHAGKGLEFDAVFITGFEEGLLPMLRRDDDNIDEERRLLYVGMTRARQYLTLSWRKRSLVFGGAKGGGSYWRDSKPSRFASDIPHNLIQNEQYPLEKNARLSFNLGSGSVGKKSVTEWHIGDSVRCTEHGRGMIVTQPARSTLEDMQVEILFSNGQRKFLNPTRSSLELLYSPNSSK